MRQLVFRFSVAILSFIIGVTVSNIWLALYSSTHHKAEIACASNDLPELKSVANEQDTEGSVEKPQYPKLARTHKAWPDKPLKIAPVQVSQSRLLVTVGDTLYMLNSRRQIIWKWDAGNGEDIVDQPYIDPHGHIFGIAIDGIVFSLDLDGKERWRWRINGAYSFKQIEPYQNDQYLMLLDASSYRENQGFDEDDTLYLCQDRDVIATTAFPRNAKLQIRGRHIYAVSKRRRGIMVREINFKKSG